MADLETLTIQINAESSKATNAIGKLAQRLDSLSVSIAKLETGKLNDLALGLNNLNTVIANMNSTSNRWDYKKIVGNLSTLGAINTQGLDNLAVSVGTLNTALTTLMNTGDISENLKQIIASIGKLGGKNIERAITNLPRLEKAFASLLKRIAKTPQINQSIIDFTNSLTNLASQGSKIGTATKSIKNSLDRFGTSATRATHKSKSLASAIGKVYAEFWLAMRAAKGLKSAFMDAADYLEAYNYFDVTAQKIGKETFLKAGEGSAEAYAQAFTETLQRKLKQMSGLELDLEDRLIKTTNAKSLGLNLTELTQYQASIASITNSMGVSQEIAASTAKAFSMLAADMGSLKNVDFEQVAGNLQSGLTGMARSLYRYGIDITQATLEQYAFNYGIEKSVSEMTQAEKAQLRLLAILDQSRVAWGDLAHTINSPSNQLRQLKNNLKEVGTVMGQLFIPVMQNVLPVLNGLSIALKQLLVDIAGILGIKLDLEAFGDGWSDSLDEDTEALDDLDKQLKKTKKGIREFDELKVIGEKSTGDAGLGDQIDLTQQILDATAEYEKVWDEAYEKMRSKAQEIADLISPIFEPVKKIVEDFHVGNFFKAGEDVSGLVKSIFDFFTKAIQDVDWDSIGNKIGDFLKGIDWIGILKSVGGLIGAALQGAFDLWTGSFSVAPFETAIITAFALLKFTGLGETLKKSVSGIIKNTLSNTKINFSQLGLGAISVGLGIALTVDNIKSISAGKYTITDLIFWIKSAISSLFTGAGFALAANAIGIASGGLAFVIGASISLVASIVLGAINEESPEEAARKVKEQELAWVDEYNLNALDIKTNISLRGDITQDSLDNLDKLAKSVWEMSQNYDNLTSVQKGWLKEYSDELVQAVPQIKGMIDEITGAYIGEKDALDELIDKQKQEITLNAYRANLQDVTTSITEGERNVKKLEDELLKLNNEMRDLEQKANREAADDPFGFRYFDVNSYTRQYANKVAEADAVAKKLNETRATVKELTTDQQYWLDKMNEIFEESFSGTEVTIETSIDNSVKIVEKQKLPKAMSQTLGKVDQKIQEGGKVAKSDMWNMFNAINDSFAGLGDGKVPSEVQATMDNIKKAIEESSPELVNYMAQLKIDMEKAFADAHYDTEGNLIWNMGAITEKLEANFRSIEGGIAGGANVSTVYDQLKNNIKEVFNGDLPDTVKKSLSKVGDAIKSGQAYDVHSALVDLANEVKIESNKIGKNVVIGGIEGLYSGKAQLGDATRNTIQTGMTDTAEQTLGESSPSKVFKKIGAYAVEGAVIGVKDETPSLVTAVKSMANSMSTVFGNTSINVPKINYSGVQNTNGIYNSYNNNDNSLFDRMASTMQGVSQPTEVVFRVEGDPHGMFKVIRQENEIYRNRTNRSAFA